MLYLFTEATVGFFKLLHIIANYTHRHTHNRFTAPDNPGEPVPKETFTHSHSSWSTIIPICFLHLLWSMASSLFNPRALQSFSTISLQVFFGLALGLAPSTSYSIHFFTQSSFRSTCPYHRNLFCCSTEIMSTNPGPPLNSLLGTLSCKLSITNKAEAVGNVQWCSYVQWTSVPNLQMAPTHTYTYV